MKKFYTTLIALSCCAAMMADTFTTRQTHVNKGGKDGGTVTLRFYDDRNAVSDIAATPHTEGRWYTLDGRTLTTAPTRKGLYIHRGRLVSAGR